MGKRFVGIDWGNEAHAVCVMDEEGGVRDRSVVEHTAEGITGMCSRLRKLVTNGHEVSVALERPSGLLVDTLAKAGLTVIPIHPNKVKASRPRYSAACGKDDSGDAQILADLIRTDGHRFRPLHGSSDSIRALQALSRTREDLVRARVRLASQLRAVLDGFWPGAAQIFYEIDSAIALAFLDRYPTPESAARLGVKRLARFLAQHRYTGKKRVEDLLEALRAAPRGRAGARECDAKGVLVRAFVASIRPLVEQIAQVSALIAHEIALLPDGVVITSFPRMGPLNGAQLLGELGDDRERFVSEDHLAAECGVVPITHASGKRRGVSFRRACNKRLRRAMTCFAENSRQASPWAKDLYDRALARGCHHPHAIRILARAWVRVLWRCWRDRKPYDPALHGGAKRVA